MDEELDLELFEDEMFEHSYAVRGAVRELIPSEVLADEWYQRGQGDLDTILERL